MTFKNRQNPQGRIHRLLILLATLFLCMTTKHNPQKDKRQARLTTIQIKMYFYKSCQKSKAKSNRDRVLAICTPNGKFKCAFYYQISQLKRVHTNHKLELRANLPKTYSMIVKHRKKWSVSFSQQTNTRDCGVWQKGTVKSSL